MIARLAALAQWGGEWVIIILALCSIWAVAVMVERLILLQREKKGLREIEAQLGQRDLASGMAWLKTQNTLAGRMAVSTLASGGVKETEHALRNGEKRRLEQRLIVLGTLGNNAPFVGLFGTVLGVIKSFHDLAAEAGAGPEVVMQGLSEALVATAVGLAVAIPCVVAYNYCQKTIHDLLGETDDLCLKLSNESWKKDAKIS